MLVAPVKAKPESARCYSDVDWAAIGTLRTSRRLIAMSASDPNTTHAGDIRLLSTRWRQRVEKEEDLAPALQRALANRPALVDVVVTPEAVSSDSRTGLAWVPDLQPLAAWDDAERNWRNSQN